MKKSKRLLVGFIALWVVGFLVVWGVTLFKKTPLKLPFGKIITPSADKVVGSDQWLVESEGQGISPGPARESEALPVRCYRVSLIDFKDELPVMGTVRGALEIDLKFEINGVVESINFREGDIIYKGDLIASLDKRDAELKVEYARTKLESAKTQILAAQKKLDIHKNLYEIGGIIKAKLEEVELEVKGAELQADSAEVELKSARSELKKTDLYAPRDGVLGAKEVEVGEFLTPNNKIATLYDTMDVFVELGIVEKDIDKIALDEEVNVTVDAYQGIAFTGNVDNVFPVIEGKSRTLTVRAKIHNPDAFLLPGMFARAMITVAEFDNAIVVPSMSLDRTDEGYKIFIVSENNIVSSRIVEVAYVTTDYTVIASGIYEGELVVIDAPQELKDGMPVNVIEVQESILEEEE